MANKKIGSNVSESSSADGKTVVFNSYRTPVAAWIRGKGCVRTDTRHSVTTSKHANKWVRGGFEKSAVRCDVPKIVKQKKLDELFYRSGGFAGLRGRRRKKRG